MNQFQRALHLPFGHLVRKLTGSKEVYTIGWRGYVPGQSLPELGRATYAALPYDPFRWYADPILFDYDDKSWVFCECFDRRTGKGVIAASRFRAGVLEPPQPVLEEPFHLSFPLVFRWRGEIWMIPETGHDHSLCLYRCSSFPASWERVQRFEVGFESCDTVLLSQSNEALVLLCSETLPENQLLVRYRAFTVTGEEAALTLTPHEAFNEAQAYTLKSRNAGPLTAVGGQVLRPAQNSTSVDYGVSLSFWAGTPGAGPLAAAAGEALPGETLFKTVTCDQLYVENVPARRMVGVHTYGHDSRFEVVDLRYFKFDPRRLV